MIQQELNPVPCKLDRKRNCRYVKGTSPSDITVTTGRLRWHRNQSHTCAPCIKIRKGEDTRKKKREVLHLFRCYTHTHTHTRPEPGQPWKARGRKKRTHDGQTAKNSAGGEGNRRTSGTNLHGETDLTKTAHTPKPHDTLRRGTRGKN